MSLSQSLKVDWHDATCRQLDCAPIDDHWATCLSCGSSGLMPYSPPTLATESSFRLLRLLPGWPEDSLRCKIHVKDLKDEPIFNAISYTWADEKGDDRKLAEIFIDGKAISVTRNCHAALRRLQQTDIVAYIWIDAICIDQENDIERGHQVKLMPQIYHQAQKVFIYVGEHDDLSLDMLKYLDIPRAQKRSKYGSKDDSFFSSKHGRVIWAALEGRKYFTRLWILQEIALARQAIVLCGTSSFPWKDITDCFADKFELAPNQQLVLGFNRSIYTRPGMELHLLDGGRPACAKDPRDKVYGLLGLLPSRRIGTVVADYTISAQQLYTEVAVQLAKIHGWPAVLARAGSKYQSLSSLPSWVPDWTCAPTKLTEYYAPPPPTAQSSQSSLPFKDRLRLGLIPYDTKGSEWIVPDLQNGSIGTYILIPQDRFWSGLLHPSSDYYSKHQRLRLTLHKSPDGSRNILYKAVFSEEKEMVHIPIEQGFFAPMGPRMLVP
ncbi:hypothetical protein PFICI_08306 [Pestalotiopsis fici W106-1]|uniref:Heterokaryon incompatibility domain-containing protein n=1 Tax=Pestalotiopsis fici (strain W106-1 / CGMCC3.15140) TaxID=1229662 RepID=W3X5X9_PESFW|nr:uncharacterized protein PFICI_08306 [Pestalotiopsis fici W106-1]ETS80777.1 hypothetical protein PFICI_08306 [Pestalotiopsis fici W106-1]